MAQQKITPINKRADWPEGQLIITKTDLKGKIVYANRTFMQVAQMHEGLLLGKPHSVIRHPDMPRGVFRYMWQVLQSGDEFFGLIKNITYNGQYYWVLANVSPCFQGTSGMVTGYFSVRRPIDHATEVAISELYQSMLATEKSGSNASVDESVDMLMQAAGGADGYRDYVLTLAGLRGEQ